MPFTISGFADEIAPELDEQLQALHTLDIHFIEMRNVNGRPIVSHTQSEIQTIRDALKKKDIQVSAIGSPIGKIGIKDAFTPHLDLFKHTLDITVQLQAPYIRMFSFFIPEGDDPAIYRDEVFLRWQAFIEAAKDYPVVLLHENEKHIYGDTAVRCKDLMETLNTPKVQAIFDPSNFIQCKTQTYPHAYELLKPWICYYHIKDATMQTGQVVPAGYGDAHLPQILKAAAKNSFEVFLSLEPHLSSYDEKYTFFDRNSPKLREGKPRKFEIAADALRKVLHELQ